MVGIDTMAGKSALDAPVRPEERLAALDILRGFAVIGIFAMNIHGFGHVMASYMNPLLAVDLTGANQVLWLINDVLIEGTMRTLFSFLFGAGVILFTLPRDGGEPAKGTSARWYRRNAWLILFGLIHGYLLLWPGEILFFYGLAGLLLYFARRWGPVLLTTWALLLFVIGSALVASNAIFYEGFEGAALEIQEVQAEEAEAPESDYDAETARTTVFGTDAEVMATYREFRSFLAPTPEEIGEELELRRGGYFDALDAVIELRNDFLDGGVLIAFLIDAMMMMLFGMALFKWGILSGDRPAAFYALLLAIGYGAGIPINIWEATGRMATGFDPGVATYLWTYNLGRLLVAFGHIGLLLLLWKSGILGWLMAGLAAAGRMALTNYVGQSVLSIFIFTGVGFGLVGRLDYPALMGVVALVSVAQVLFSVLWLQAFRFGPLEWLWRTLTYWRVQPMRRAA